MSADTSALGDLSRGVPIPFAKKLLVQIGAFVSLTIVCLALWVVYRTLQSIQLSDVLEQFRALPATSVLLAFLLTAGAYFVVSGYDVLALYHIGRPVPYRRAALAGCLANACVLPPLSPRSWWVPSRNLSSVSPSGRPCSRPICPG